MVGKQQIQITGTQLAAGLATSDVLGDGGMGVESQNINPLLTAGAITATAGVAQGNPNGITTGVIIASSEDSRASTAAGRIMVDSQGQWYSVTIGSGITWVASGTAGAYFSPSTDMVAFNNRNFATTGTNIARLDPSSGSLSEAYWSSTLGQGTPLNANVPHPMLVYQKLCWVADGNKLHNFTTSNTCNNTVIQLDPNDVITSLGIDPGTGLMLIGTSTESDGGIAFGSKNFIDLFDGYSSTVRRKIPVEGRISSFYSVGGNVFVALENNIGTWNGNGVTYMRRFSGVTTSSTRYLAKQRVYSFQNTFLVADGKTLFAYGDIQNGKKAWYPLYTGTANIDAISYIGNDTSSTTLSPVIMVNAFASGVLATTFVEPFGTTAGTAVFYTNNINFPRPVFIRHVRVFTTGITTTAGIGQLGIIDENQVVHNPVVKKFVVASGTKYVFDFPFGGQKLQTMQPVLNLDTQQFGIIKIVIYYDTAE